MTFFALTTLCRRFPLCSLVGKTSFGVGIGRVDLVSEVRRFFAVLGQLGFLAGMVSGGSLDLGSLVNLSISDY